MALKCIQWLFQKAKHELHWKLLFFKWNDAQTKMQKNLSILFLRENFNQLMPTWWFIANGKLFIVALSFVLIKCIVIKPPCASKNFILILQSFKSEKKYMWHVHSSSNSVYLTTCKTRAKKKWEIFSWQKRKKMCVLNFVSSIPVAMNLIFGVILLF